MNRLGRGALGLLIALPMLLHTPPAVRADAPRFVLVTSPLLLDPVLLDDWDANYRLLWGELQSDVSAATLDDRPSFDLWLFWGEAWTAFADSGQPLDTLRTEQANQHGRFYPIADDGDALIVLDPVPGAAGTVHTVPAAG